VLVLLLAVGAGGGGWWFGSGRYVSTPGVIDLTAAAAEHKVEAAGLTFEVAGRAYSETVPVGSVVSTDPAGGEQVLRDGTVNALLSKGPERHQVPALRGLSLDQAQDALREANLVYGDAAYRFNERVAKGVVLSADPAPGTELKRGAAVDVVVSKGPRPVKVPDFTGKPADAATKALERRGLEVRRTEQNDDSVPKGAVISQSPSSGTLFRGDTVELVVSKGPVLVEVPDVRRMGTEAAKQTLTEAGFQVEVQRAQYYVGLEYVVNQSPGDGEKAPQGSKVVIFVV